jgi:hypothetical protein
MAGKLNLTQPRPAAVPTNQRCQLVGLHDLSGVTEKEFDFFSNAWCNSLFFCSINQAKRISKVNIVIINPLKPLFA